MNSPLNTIRPVIGRGRNPGPFLDGCLQTGCAAYFKGHLLHEIFKIALVIEGLSQVLCRPRYFTTIEVLNYIKTITEISVIITPHFYFKDTEGTICRSARTGSFMQITHDHHNLFSQIYKTTSCVLLMMCEADSPNASLCSK
jgi:hypothetical protein